jgi:TolA-binding protein
MWRFLLPALTMTTSLIVLLAGVLGDLKSLPDLSDRAIAITGGTGPRHALPRHASAPSVASGAALAEQQAVREGLQRHIADLQRQARDLQNQIAQRSHEVEARRTEKDGLRQSLESMRAETELLRQQRQAEEDALARDKARGKIAANAPRRTPAPRAAAPSLTAAPTGPSAVQELLNAQQWLATGRPDQARQILAIVQTQIVLRPVTPDHPMTEGGNPSASDIGAAIRWLDMGANGQAMQAISRAIKHANAVEALSSPWAGYPGQPAGRYYANDGR